MADRDTAVTDRDAVVTGRDAAVTGHDAAVTGHDAAVRRLIPAGAQGQHGPLLPGVCVCWCVCVFVRACARARAFSPVRALSRCPAVPCVQYARERAPCDQITEESCGLSDRRVAALSDRAAEPSYKTLYIFIYTLYIYIYIYISHAKTLWAVAAPSRCRSRRARPRSRARAQCARAARSSRSFAEGRLPARQPRKPSNRAPPLADRRFPPAGTGSRRFF